MVNVTNMNKNGSEEKKFKSPAELKVKKTQPRSLPLAWRDKRGNTKVIQSVTQKNFSQTLSKSV